MNSDMTFKISTDGPEATVKVGERVGNLLSGGEVIELTGDLGSGKTTIMKGILSAMGYKGDVPSPTYTISRVYGLRDSIQLYHFDFYRIHGADMVVSELTEILDEPSAIVAVEWSDNIGEHVLPYDRIKITLVPGFNYCDRKICVESTSPKYDYVVKGLQG